MRATLSTYEEPFRRSLIFIALYSLPAFLVASLSTVSDPDVWWHLRTGQWIVQQRWVPYSDWFSSYGMGKPWAAYSWLFEIVIYELFIHFGLIGLLVYVYALVLAIAAALHSLVRKLQPGLAISVALTALGLFTMARLYAPRPWLFTVLFLILELNVLVDARRYRKYRILLLLPPLFALWANLHIQFVYGLFVLGLAALEGLLKQLLRQQRVDDIGPDRPLPPGTMILITIACLIATVFNPYHFRIYAVVFDYVRQPGLYDLISELQPLQFRTFPDWFVLLLTLGAAFALGKRRDVSLFWSSLFLAGAFLSFRSSRDLWFVTIIAIVVIAVSVSTAGVAVGYGISKAQLLFGFLLTGTILGITVWAYHISNAHLQKIVAENYPVGASSFIEEHGFSGTLYNHFNWGGYLIWRLPNMPVSIDGRSNVHNADRMRHSLKVWNGEHAWASDSELAGARVVIGQRDLALTQLLRLDGRFELVYEDNVAAVFVRGKKMPTP
jgi:hypothetical protein